MSDKLSREELIEKYAPEVKKLLKYLPWLEAKSGCNVSSNYAGDGLAVHSMTFPVYDSTLLTFVREVKQSPLIDKNYAYVYTRNGISTPKDERKIIALVKLQDMHILWGIMSKYVLGGMTKSTVWSQGMEEGIFLALVKKMKEIVEFHDGPLA
ncbi:MAG: hypothetical protein IJ485_07490 [Lachnospiraceae bacterium]|nr:hypothetical protein [Lachnospiraceae bacterium]